VKDRSVLRAGLFLAVVVSIPAWGFAQAPTVVATGLRAPTKITLSDDGYLLVTESGNGPNTGAVSRVSRCGQQLRIIDGLPSGIGPRGEPSGATGIDFQGTTLYVAIGAGDATIAGPPPTELPNPKPSSPLLSSLLQVELSVDLDELQSGFELKRSDQDLLKAGLTVTLTNAQAASAKVKLIVDFPDYTNDPVLNARVSNPFALTLVGQRIFLADASQNTILRIDLPSGAVTKITTLGPIPNPLFPTLGPPVRDPVPDSIRFFEGRLLVTLLTGFPFAPGSAQVLSIDPVTGSSQTGIAGLTTAIDVVPVRTRNGNEEYFTLEHSLNQLVPNTPGRLQLFSGTPATLQLITGGLLSPTGMVRDPRSGDVFVTEYFPGRILQVAGAGEDGFDASLEDDETGDVLRFNTLTGDYLFVSCRLGTQFSGVARVRRLRCTIALLSARIDAELESCSGSSRTRGAARVTLTNGQQVFIHDSNGNNNRNVGR
jgi:hypothetical protein